MENNGNIYWKLTTERASESSSILAPTTRAVVAKIPVVTRLHFSETVVPETEVLHVVVIPADPVAINEDSADTLLVAVTVALLFTADTLNASLSVAISVLSFISTVVLTFAPTQVKEVGTVNVKIVVAELVVRLIGIEWIVSRLL